MTNDQTLVAACMADRKAWTLVRDHLESEDLGPQAEIWLEHIDRWYRVDPGAPDVLPDVLLEGAYSKLPKGHADGLVEWFRELPKVSSGVNIARTVLELKREVAARELAGALLTGSPSGDLLRRYSELQEATELADTREVDDGHWAPDDIQEILAARKPENLIPLFPKALNAAVCGGVEPGDHIVVFGRPEMGKSMFALNMAHGWANHGLRVLYVGNEDAIVKLKRRLVGAMANMTIGQMNAHPDLAWQRAQARGLSNVKMWWQRNMTIAQLEDKIREVRPDCLIIDQIRNLQSAGDGTTRKLADLAPAVRGLIGKYHLVGLSTNQGNDRTQHHGQEPPTWLTMGDVADSRTDLPGQADVLLGLGANQEMKDLGQRACSILKNKGEGSHEGFIFTVDKDRTRIW